MKLIPYDIYVIIFSYLEPEEMYKYYIVFKINKNIYNFINRISLLVPNVCNCNKDCNKIHYTICEICNKQVTKSIQGVRICNKCENEEMFRLESIYDNRYYNGYFDIPTMYDLFIM